ncbi:MAG: MetQ/NlpA family ABC transporter substrate-binding protein, partial [Succinivibrio dextrinosolvens]|nr:MetQ/NlpA family ABC transporter substrate-binding protein [Succinivibrio dextrinosolvens]MDY6470942.1 MetQ/NlpA family ABC transporter substrate-binding protein [Succinivibrio dextrinosolvens]
YSKRIKSLKGLNKGDSVAIPADRSNEIRSLRVLKGEDLIDFEIDPQSGEIVFTKNQLHLEFKLYDAALLYGSLDEVTCAFINGNYAFENGLNPVTDSIFREKLDLGDSDNPFVKVLVANSNVEEDKQRILRRALFYYQTGAVAEIIKQMQGGSLIPAFLPRF